MPKKSRRAAQHEAAEQPAATRSAPTPEYAALGADAPIAWPAAGMRRVPVTGQLSPHATAALQRMGITK